MIRFCVSIFLKIQNTFFISVIFSTFLFANESHRAASLSSPSKEEISKYCSNIVDIARDQRYVLQKEELEKLKKEVDNRINLLEKHKVEYQHWLTRYEKFFAITKKSIVDIYKKMTSAAAAAQLEKINPETASSILIKLNARQASSIMAEMDPQKAAVITNIISNLLNSKLSKGSS
ncbi:hypothetical protein B488_02040 [Liberibacter crescens BT-1]|uniref:Magnesium transporter MgtE intracellular domain-containing protein n=1 Tax=Liberibacter crescens (strain BT-1) TaxID=1215343 RepID=L0ETB6_LIBCB|nr:MotE family protein [Liberibacter crescens]AGA64197.1 hypothetical protein B488_02040 [Liberibacter crescens BT-1]